MADRFDFYLEQVLTEGELDGAFDAIERAIWDLAIDLNFTGITSGLAVSESGPTALTVDVALGTAYTGEGKRLKVAPDQDDFDCSVDENAVATTVLGGGNERWISIFAGFDRVLSDQRIDGASMAVWFNRAEGFSLIVRQGAEAAAGLAVRPALDTSLVLLADVLLTNGMVAIANGDISVTRRQDFTVYTAAQVSYDDSGHNTIFGATVQAVIFRADQELGAEVSRTDDHTTGTNPRHTGTHIDVVAGSFVQLTGTDVQGLFDEVDPDLKTLAVFLRDHYHALLLFDGAPSDGGGLTLDISFPTWIARGEGFESLVNLTQTLADNSSNWVFLDENGANVAATAGGIGLYGVPIAKVVTLAGSIQTITDMRIKRDRENQNFIVRVGNGADSHFSNLNKAITTLEAWRVSFTNLKFEIEISGTCFQDVDANLPITPTLNDWRIKGMPGAAISWGGAAETVDLALFDLTNVDGFELTDLNLRLTTSVAPDGVTSERYLVTASNADRCIFARLRMPELDEGLHGLIKFDSATECSDWRMEDLNIDDCRDFGIWADSPATGGQSVLIKSVIRDCRFKRNSKGVLISAVDDAVNLEEGADVLIDNVIADGMGAIRIGDGDAARRVRVRDCAIVNSHGSNGIWLGQNAEQCEIKGCDVAPGATNGIGVTGSYNRIIGNESRGVTNGILSVAPGVRNIFALNQTRGDGMTMAVNNNAVDNFDDV